MSPPTYVRVPRTRPASAGPVASLLSDEPLGPWREDPPRVDEVTKLLLIVNRIRQSHYGALSRSSKWPKDFSSKKKRFKREEREAMNRVMAQVKDAIICQLSDRLSPLQLKVLLLVAYRTLGWGKFQEGVPFSHATQGVYIKGRRQHAPATASKTHFNEAVQSLVQRGYLQAGEAESEYGTVKVLELNIENVLRAAQSASRQPKPIDTQRVDKRRPVPNGYPNCFNSQQE